MQRHLTALETYFVESAGTRFLTFVATTCRFTDTGANAATNAKSRMLGAGCWLYAI
jgi:hypothetical protein